MSLLNEDDTLTICFERVIAMDSGAALGICDGIQFAREISPSVTIHLVHINVRLTRQTLLMLTQLKL